MPLFAVHISDGVLSDATVALGFVGAALLLAPALYRVRDEEISRIALLTAAFFVSSSIRVPFGPTTVHLLLNALVGVTLGRRAPLAIAVGLLLQVLLLAHGGFTTLGINMVVITLPALLAGIIFRALLGAHPTRRRAVCVGAVIGWFTVILTAGLNAAVLVIGGKYDWTIIAAPQFVIYVFLGFVEGMILGVTAGYLVRVKPELLRLKQSRPQM
ncbi:MAG TPA: CbiM family transporter [Gemmataceae bacterium]|nr:CbiM family transporter [Gemmataceae bacterium]